MRGEGPVKIFVNYRRDDSGGWAGRLYDQLAAHFGADSVFFDVESLEPGMHWLSTIRGESAACPAFVALIGQRWAEIMQERVRAESEDHVRGEIESALRRDSAFDLVIPALVDDADLPRELDVPASIRPLLRREAVELRPTSWRADVQELIAVLERPPAPRRVQPRFAAQPPAFPPAPPEPAPEEPSAADERVATPAPRVRSDVASPPDEAHLDEVAAFMIDEDAVVPFLGQGANSSDRTAPWGDRDGDGLPDADELAAHLAQKLKLTGRRLDLAQVSQYYAVARRETDLYRTLRRTFARAAPGSVHRFLATYPARMHALGVGERYQLVVTTNYDDALERAFDEAEEPYDLAVYSRARRRFVHVPHGGEPQVVEVANSYRGFPIDPELGQLRRTVIMKIHGAVQRFGRADPWEDNYVITEDDYIGYLSDGPIEQVVPTDLLAKLRYSHFLFLGFTMRDWNLRVFLQRIFGGQLPMSWAIQREPEPLDREYWDRLGPELYAASLRDYVEGLGTRLERFARAGA
jgi:SIR2-like domain/TIR domain